VDIVAVARYARERNEAGMGDVNQYHWVGKYRDRVRGPVLEIGSRHYAASVSNDFRALCGGQEYVGVDMSAGANVDLVVDFTQDFSLVSEQLGGRRFGTILCMSVMEHVSDIIPFAKNLTEITTPGGVLFLSVPFVWRFHGYPSDYWRFSPEGVKQLFPQFEFDEAAGMLSSNVPGDRAPFSSDVNAFALEKRPRSLLRMLGLKPKASYVLKPTMVSMLGRRRG
jgi:SAM-dependent methyltransferase